MRAGVRAVILLPSPGTPGEGPGVRAGQSVTECTALTPSPSPMSTRERGEILPFRPAYIENCYRKPPSLLVDSYANAVCYNVSSREGLAGKGHRQGGRGWPGRSATS